MIKLNNANLRSFGPRELALHLRHAAIQHSEQDVASHLLAAIEQEALPPTVFNTFLTAVDTPPLLDAITQQFSRHIRSAAIRNYGEQLRSTRWETA